MAAESLAQGRAPSAPLVYVVVLNWNGWQDTMECLQSLSKITYAHSRVIVVDNGSTDDSVDRIRERFPECSVLRAATNLGYTGGNNLGVAHAAARGADAVLFLNNDTIVSAGFLEPLVEALYSGADAGAVGPRILHEPSEGGVWFDGAVFRPELGQTRHLRFGEPEPEGPPEPVSTDFVSGCALLTRLDVLREVGSFDDSYFCYSEDVDLSLRIRDGGYRCLLAPRSRIWHKVGRTVGSSLSPTYLYYTRRNRLLLMLKHSETCHWPSFLVHYLLSYIAQTYLALWARGTDAASWAAVQAAVRDFAGRRFGKRRGA